MRRSKINYVLEGEIWFFVEERGFLCKAGDFHRIPSHKFMGIGTVRALTQSWWRLMLPALVAGKLQQTSIGLIR